MIRREFIMLLGGAAAAWPIAGRAQQSDRMRRIGVLTNLAADDADSPARVAAFAKRLQELGWTSGRNILIDYRWSGGDPNLVRRFTAELVTAATDVLLVSSGSALAAVKNATSAVPIVFVSVTDPVSNGYVASLARPGANITGFTLLEYGTSGKWLELLKQIAPSATRAAVLCDPSITSGRGQLAAIQEVAPSVGIEATPVDVRDATGFASTIAEFHGLIVTISPVAMFRRDEIIALAARHRLPAVYPVRSFVNDGGLTLWA
jgi:ABC-type uncharacterized transport system substrate-binding protein